MNRTLFTALALALALGQGLTTAAVSAPAQNVDYDREIREIAARPEVVRALGSSARSTPRASPSSSSSPRLPLLPSARTRAAAASPKSSAKRE